MPLWLPPPQFHPHQHNLPATPNTTVLGGTITTSATAHTKGTWASLLDPVDFDTHWVVISIHATNAAATQTDTLIDIGIGPSGGGSEQVILPNLLAGWKSGLGGAHMISLPLYIPKGVRISGRGQSIQTSKTVRTGIFLYGGAANSPWGTFRRADDYGTSTSTSSGTVLDPPTTGAGNESAWTSIGGTTSKPYGGVLLGIGGTGADTTTTSIAYHIEVGYSSTTLGEYWTRGDTGEFFHPLVPSLPIFTPIPTGTQLQARIEQSGTDAQDLDVALYGLY